MTKFTSGNISATLPTSGPGSAQYRHVLFGLSVEPLPGWLGWRGHAHNLAARVLFAVRFSDVDCPFRLLRRFQNLLRSWRQRATR